MTACLTDIFCRREKVSWLLVFLFFQIAYSMTVKMNQTCYSPGYLYIILTGFCTCPPHSWTCRLPCCQMKFVFVYFVLTYNCNLGDETNIFYLPFPEEAISTSVYFRVGLSFLRGCLSINRQCGFHNLFSSEGNK